MVKTAITVQPGKVAPKVKAGSNDKDAILKEARKRYQIGYDANKKNFNDAKDDLLHVSGEGQWPDDLRKERESKLRPCLTINKLPTFIGQVVGDQRQNRPQIKVHPVDRGADQQTAEIYEGLIRNIETCSQADVAYDHAYECAVSSGWGWIRVVTEYSDDDVFDQDIRIKRVPNSFSVVWDPASTQFDMSDANWMFVTEIISKDEFETRFPKASLSNFDSNENLTQYWTAENDGIRIAEYFRKVPKRKTIYLWQDGSVTDELIDGLQPLKSRSVDSYEIEWYLVSGSDVLDGPKVWPGRYFPLIPVWGKELWVDGKRWFQSLIRHAKDAQRLYNYDRTTYAETLALQPRVPYLLTPDQVEGHERQWDTFFEQNWPYILFNPDPLNPGRPTREAPPMISQGVLQGIQIADVELKSTTGLFDPSLGDRQGQQSGKAILSLQRKGDIGTFTFSDNLGRAITHLARVLVDLIPKIYDTERVVRILGFDGKESNIVVNQRIPSFPPAVLNDITVGKYDVSVSFGPSFATQRIEAANAMIQFCTQGMPKEMVVGVADIIAENLDWPGKELFIRRIKKLQPPGLHEDEAGNDPNKPPSPVQMQQMQQMQFQQMQQQAAMQKMQLDMEAAKAEIELKKIQAAKTAAEISKIKSENDQREVGMAKMVQDIEGTRIDHDRKRVDIVKSIFEPVRRDNPEV